MTNLEKLPTTIDPAVAAAMLVPERLNNQSLHAEAIQNAIFQRVRARLVADGKGQPRRSSRTIVPFWPRTRSCADTSD